MKKQRVLKGAIVGFGFISSKGHMPAYEHRFKNVGDVEIIAVCDKTLARKKDVPETVRFYTDFQEMLAAEMPELDFIDVSTHAADHYPIAKWALQNGLHVLCEKPLTIKTEEALDLILTAIKNQKVLFPCHNYKHAPVVKALKELIEKNVIGTIHSVTMNTFRNTHAVGIADWNPDWRRQKCLSGGGIGMDHGSHSLYLLFDWLKGYPQSVTAASTNRSPDFYDTEDNFYAVYEFQNGNANIHLSWTAGVRKVLYALQGEKGSITVDDDQLEIAIKKTMDHDGINHQATWKVEKKTLSSDWMDSSHVSWFNSLFDRFVQAIEMRDYENADLMDAYFCIKSIMASYESIEKNSSKVHLNCVFPSSHLYPGGLL